MKKDQSQEEGIFAHETFIKSLLLTLKSPISVRLNRKPYAEAADDFFVLKVKTIEVEWPLVDSTDPNSKTREEKEIEVNLVGWVNEDSDNRGIWRTKDFGGEIKIMIRTDNILSRQNL